jgi:integrase
MQKRGGIVSTNRCLGRLRAFYNWAAVSGYVEATPFKKGGVNVIRLFKELERERRLEPQEENLLLAEANPKLRALIVAALETGCRIGELVALRWRQVRWDLNEIHLSNRTTKGQRTRCLPMSQRVRAALEMRQHDPAGNVLPGDAYVFGDDVGGQVKSAKTAWENLRLRIYGHAVTRLANGKLAPCCRAKARVHQLAPPRSAARVRVTYARGRDAAEHRPSVLGSRQYQHEQPLLESNQGRYACGDEALRWCARGHKRGTNRSSGCRIGSPFGRRRGA